MLHHPQPYVKCLKVVGGSAFRAGYEEDAFIGSPGWVRFYESQERSLLYDLPSARLAEVGAAALEERLAFRRLGIDAVAGVLAVVPNAIATAEECA